MVNSATFCGSIPLVNLGLTQGKAPHQGVLQFFLQVASAASLPARHQRTMGNQPTCVFFCQLLTHTCNGVSRCGPAAVVGRRCSVFRRAKLIIIFLAGGLRRLSTRASPTDEPRDGTRALMVVQWAKVPPGQQQLATNLYLQLFLCRLPPPPPCERATNGQASRRSSRACARRSRLSTPRCRVARARARATGVVSWPFYDIAITNNVWCIAYTREVGRGALYCPIIVQ